MKLGIQNTIYENKEMIAPNFPNLMKIISPQFLKARDPKQDEHTHANTDITRFTIIKYLKTTEKEYFKNS